MTSPKNLSVGTLVTPVILSGGAGTRLWPLSRTAKPKQLHAIGGARTMVQMTAERVSSPALFAPPVLVSSARHVDAIEVQLEAIGAAPSLLVLEPEGRNTAAAIALAALTGPEDALLLVLPSDHVIRDPAAFLAAVETGASLARDGFLVTFGIRPDRAETGYGYIKRGESLRGGAFRAARFVEKPDRATAESYLAEGDYDWNGGIFLFRADRVLAELAQHAPDILELAKASVADGRLDGYRFHPGEAAFKAVRSQSIDHAIMEQAERVAVVPVEMGWSDVGSWDALYDLAAKDETGNVAVGDVLARDSRGCLLRSDGPTLVTIGVENLIVVATGDTVVIMPRGESQRVKEAVEAIAKAGRDLL